MKFKLFSPSNDGKDLKTAKDESGGQSSGSETCRLQREMTIEPEADVFDNVLSNPHSYPITIIPNRPNILYGLSAHNSKTFQRQTSGRAR